MRESSPNSAAAVNKLSTGLVSQTPQTALSGEGEVQGAKRRLGRKNEGKKERVRGNEESGSCAVAVRHGVIKASRGFLWVKEEEERRENGDKEMIQDSRCWCLGV